MCNLAPCCPARSYCLFYVFFLCFEQINDDDDDAKIALIYAEVKYKVHIN